MFKDIINNNNYLSKTIQRHKKNYDKESTLTFQN